MIANTNFQYYTSQWLVKMLGSPCKTYPSGTVIQEQHGVLLTLGTSSLAAEAKKLQLTSICMCRSKVIIIKFARTAK